LIQPRTDAVLAGPCNLITGALGFVGRHLLRSLVAAGIPCVGVDRPGVEPPRQLGIFDLAGEVDGLPGAVRFAGPLGDFLLFRQDLLDPEGLAALVDRLRPVMVYHLAAQSSAGDSFRDPAGTFTANVTGTVNLYEAIRALPDVEWPIILSVGSAEEYGPQDDPERPIDEEAPLRPISPYGVSKAAQTLLSRQYVTSWELPIISARSFSHTGPGQDTRFAFPAFARQIAEAEAGRGPTEIRVGDLSARRDYLDVRDVVDAYRLLMKEGRPGEVYNVCSGSELTMREGLEILVRSASTEITVTKDPARCRPSDIPVLVGNNSKLVRDTGWSPQYEFEQTLADVLTASREELT